MRNILVSLLLLGFAAALVGSGTLAYFSDTETSENNVFGAGMIDISIDDENPWISNYTMEDLKPCETGWINFTIKNLEKDDPVKIYKHINITGYDGGLHPESEEAEDLNDEINDIGKNITYDLHVAIYNETGALVHEEWIIEETENVKVEDIDCYWIYLGDIPQNGTMVVNQSYHMQPEVTNWAQGDIMYFDIEVLATQTNAPAPSPLWP
ncbi:TasA family protein [Archaeoglobus veneficus]|uniref:SipW-cognate class signal peptide n=1 Tax=Archaeoglobus veneficus (strain DSM 11195 / SNP6) TaxID=693661 RepID=F2KN29_ARCVS|nr:TasA family protein [Archaeoglobus veneficus]AEA47305.1 hypothetical protein Arcve_1299 [Archaeoglobus veneficus SNP6]